MARSNKKNFSLPTVRFDQRQITDSIKADLRDNIGSLSDVASTDRQMLYEAALRAILAGGDLYGLSQTLIGIGMTKRRAREVSCYLSVNATILMEAERREKLGITHAIWLYSGVPCGNYEQDLEHRAADGKYFPVTEGLYIGDRFTLPGRGWNCHCCSKAVLPELRVHEVLEDKIQEGDNNKHSQAEWFRKISKLFYFRKIKK
ncbi:hypothetical protein [Oceanimonas smirnovii]|uniref:hypothetical protein n=1 Tax=Oceanimonas smirnovii TaxID=264574 RepID=UPI003FD36630